MTEPQEVALGIRGMGVSPIDVGRLAEATPRDKIKQRAGPHSKYCDKPCSVQHPKLDYITARYVMERLDEVVGPEFWQSKHTMVGDKVQCSIGLKIDGEWVWKSDGAGETDIEGQKGSFSDSFKRAAVSWGIGRDLYDKDRPASTVASAPVQRTASAEDDEDVRPIRQITPPTGGAEGRCPEHELPWTLKPGGISKATNKPYDPFYACAFRPERGQKFCNEKPSKAWLARQEVA